MKPGLTIVPLILLLSLAAGAGIGQKNDKELWRDRYTVEVKELLRIGTDDLGDEIYTFSGINDLQIDSQMNIYALDRREMNIKIFSRDGKHQKTIFLKKGQGPGEFSRPLMFSIGAENCLFVTDGQNRRVVRLDRDGKFLEYLPMDFFPALIGARDNSLFVTAAYGDTGKNALHEFDYPGKKLVRSFCELDANNLLYRKVGGGGTFCINSEGDLLFVSSLPYDIRRFSRNGELKGRFSRDLGKDVGFKINSMGLAESKLVNLGIAAFRDGKILNYILDRGAAPIDGYFDFFSKSGEWLLTLSTNRHFDKWFGNVIRVDGNDGLYLVFWEPFPHVRKYSLTFSRRG